MKKAIKKSLAFIMAAVMCLPLMPVTVFANDAPSEWAREQVNSAINAGLVPQNLRSNYAQATTRK